MTEAYRKARAAPSNDPSPQIIRASSIELKPRHQCQVELVDKDPLRGSTRLGIWLIGEHLAAIGGRDLMDRVYEAAGEDVAVDRIWDGICVGGQVMWAS